MSASEVWDLALGALQGLAASTVFLLVLMIGFCVVFGLSKFRATSRSTKVIKSLEERVGQEAFARYLTPTDPRGQVDQLHTPELLEAAARKS